MNRVTFKLTGRVLDQPRGTKVIVHGEFDINIYQRTGFYIDELSPTPYSKDVKTPILVV
jgi:hypothetical protein